MLLALKDSPLNSAFVVRRKSVWLVHVYHKL